MIASGGSLGGRIVGAPERQLDDISLSDINISGVNTGFQLRNVSITRSNMTVTPRSGAAFVVQENVQIADR